MGEHTVTARLTTGPQPGELVLFAMDGLQADISEVVVFRSEHGLDFDMNDERRSWHDHGSGGPAMVTAGTDANPDWELWLDDRYIARSDLLGFIDGEEYRTCFTAKPGAGGTASMVGQVSAFDEGGYLDSNMFTVTGGPSQHCLDFMAGPSTHLEFARATGGVPGGITIDDVKLGCAKCPCDLCSPGSICLDGMCAPLTIEGEDAGDANDDDGATTSNDEDSDSPATSGYDPMKG